MAIATGRLRSSPVLLQRDSTRVDEAELVADRQQDVTHRRPADQQTIDVDGSAERSVSQAGLDQRADGFVAGGRHHPGNNKSRHNRTRCECSTQRIDGDADVDELGVERKREQLLLREQRPRRRQRVGIALGSGARLLHQRGGLREAANGLGKGSLLGRHGQRAPRHLGILEQVSVLRKPGISGRARDF